MRRLVVDASVAIKWIVPEVDADAALELLPNQLVAPDLLLPECANSIWKKHHRGELSSKEAALAVELLLLVEVEIIPSRPLIAAATRIACRLDHPAYDCFYLALAVDSGAAYVTADSRLLKLLARKAPDLSQHVRPLHVSGGLT